MKIENEITSDRDHDKYITTQELNDLTAQIVASRLGKANLTNKNDIANFVKKKKKNRYAWLIFQTISQLIMWRKQD